MQEDGAAEMNQGQAGPAAAGARPRRRRRWLRVLLFVLAAFFILREFGVTDLNLYRSSQIASFQASCARSGDGSKFSYLVRIMRGKTKLLEHHIYVSDRPIMNVMGQFDAHYMGNSWLPLYKSFTLEYQCPFEGGDQKTGPWVKGKVEGNVKVRVVGLCSGRKAREIALENAQESAKKYVIEHLSEK